jgi:hypothetical protein
VKIKFPKPVALWLSWSLFGLGNIVGWIDQDAVAGGFLIYGVGLIAGFNATVRGPHHRLGFLALLLNCLGLLFAVILGGVFSVLELVAEFINGVG